MFDLAVGLNKSGTLRTIKHHINAMNIQKEILDAIKTFLVLKGVTSFNTIRSFNLTSESSINIVLGSLKGDVSLTIQELNNKWLVMGFFLKGTAQDTANTTICSLPIQSNSSSDTDGLNGILIQGAANIKSGQFQQYRFATDPPFYIN